MSGHLSLLEEIDRLKEQFEDLKEENKRLYDYRAKHEQIILDQNIRLMSWEGICINDGKQILEQGLFLIKKEKEISSLLIENEKLLMGGGGIRDLSIKLTKQETLLKECLDYIKNHRWFDENDELPQKLIAHLGEK